MTFQYIPYLILTGLMGIHSITTVEKLSVKSGDSVSIPCLYDAAYINHVKYLCKGYLGRYCSYAVKTNQTDNTGKFSISDDTNRRIFTVTINNLTGDDKHYWCAVEIEHELDVRQYFRLSVTTDKPELSVEQQEIAAFEGGSVTVLCRYKYKKPKEWCRLGSTCVKDRTGSIDGAKVKFNRSARNVFSVTMTELRTENSGWYWCSNSDFQMPVHITVQESTSTTTTTVILNTARTHSTTTQNSPQLTSTETRSAVPTGAGGESLQVETQSSTKVKILISTIAVQLLIVPAALFAWRRIRHNKTKPEGTDITANSQTGSDSDVLYATVVHHQHEAGQNKQNHIPDDSVTYSAIVTTSKRAAND